MESPRPKGQVKAIVKFIGQLLVGLLLFSLLILVSDFSSLERLTTLRWLPMIGAFLCTVGIAVSVGVRWGVLTRALSERPVTSWVHFCYYFLLNRLVGFFVPKDLSDLGGRAALLATKHDVPVVLAGLSVVLDRLSDVLVMLMFSGPALLFLSRSMSAGAGVVMMVGLAVVVYVGIWLGHRRVLTVSIGLYNRVIDVICRLPILRRRSFKRLQSLNLPLKTLQLKTLQHVYLLSLAKFLFTALRWMFFAAALNVPDPPIIFLFGTPVGQLSFLFAFTPGGLGIFEAGWYAILVQAGVSETYISPLLVEQRVLTMLFVGVAVLLGSLLLWWKKPRPSVLRENYSDEQASVSE